MSAKTFKTMGAAQAYALSLGRGVYQLIVAHDDWCRGPDQCNCSPDYVVMPATDHGLAEAARLEREFLARRPS